MQEQSSATLRTLEMIAMVRKHSMLEMSARLGQVSKVKLWPPFATKTCTRLWSLVKCCPLDLAINLRGCMKTGREQLHSAPHCNQHAFCLGFPTTVPRHTQLPHRATHYGRQVWLSELSSPLGINGPCAFRQSRAFLGIVRRPPSLNIACHCFVRHIRNQKSGHLPLDYLTAIFRLLRHCCRSR